MDNTKLAGEHRCNTCRDAAENGHLNCLQCARENGCDWDIWVCTFAAARGHLNILQWARDNGYDWDIDFCLDCAIENNHSHVVEWINEIKLKM
jgi:hypothetical protein